MQILKKQEVNTRVIFEHNSIMLSYVTPLAAAVAEKPDFIFELGNALLQYVNR